MHIEQTLLDPLNAELVVHLEPEDYKERYEKALKAYRKKMDMPGFRPGHVPASIVQKKYGKSLLAEELNHILQESIFNFIREKELNILGAPVPVHDDEHSGNWDNPGQFKFKYELGLAPDFELQLDKNQSFSYYKLTVDATLVDKQVNDYARRYGKMSSPDVSAEEDLLEIQLHEKNAEGILLEKGISNKTNIWIKDITDTAAQNQLTGLKKGDHITINPHKLHANHEILAEMLGVTHQELHHVESEFDLEVIEIKHIDPHELNQELFDKIYGEGKINTHEEFKATVKTELENNFVRESEWLFTKEFTNEIIKRLNPQLPDEFLKKWMMLNSETPISREEIDYVYPSQAIKLRWMLIENKIKKEFGLNVTLDEAKAHLATLFAERLAAYGMEPDSERTENFIKSQLSDQKKAEDVFDQLSSQKIMSLVKERCSIQEKYLGYDEFVHRLQH